MLIGFTFEKFELQVLRQKKFSNVNRKSEENFGMSSTSQTNFTVTPKFQGKFSSCDSLLLEGNSVVCVCELAEVHFQVFSFNFGCKAWISWNFTL